MVAVEPFTDPLCALSMGTLNAWEGKEMAVPK